MTELVLNCSEGEGLELIKAALENTEGISEYFIEGRQVVAKTSVGFPRILWSYGEKLIIDVSDSPQENQIVIDVSAEKEIWANIGSNPEKFKGRFLSEFEKVRDSHDVLSNNSNQRPEVNQSRAVATDKYQSKEVNSHRQLSSGVKKYTIIIAIVIISTSLLFTVVNLAIWANTPNIGPVEDDSTSIDQNGGLESSNSDGVNPYKSSGEWTEQDKNTQESSVNHGTDSSTTVDYQELRPLFGCALASQFDSDDHGNYHVGIMESEFPPDTCDDVLASNPDVNIPRYEAECDDVDVVSPLIYAFNASLDESQEDEYDKYQDQRLIGVVLTPDLVSADSMRCRLQTFNAKAKLHVATPMTKWDTTKTNLKEWGISESTTLWAYNSTYMVNEDSYTK